MKITRKSAITGNVSSRDIPANPDDMLAWEQGLGNIQSLMPYLSDSDREFILSGITDNEWANMFAEELAKEDV